MPSKPYFVPERGRWYIKWYAGPERGWVKQMLCSHPGPWKKSGPPKKAPAEVELIARKYRDLETQARHGVSVAKVRGHEIGEHLDQYRRDFAVKAAAGSMPTLDRVIRLFKTHCADRGIKTIEGVTAAVCRAYLTKRAEDGKSHATIQTEKGMLSPIWTLAKTDGIIDRNPWESAPLPTKPKEEAPPYWTKDELARLVAGTGGWLRDLILVGANTGLRISAILALEWRDVSFERNVVICRAASSKSGRRYEVPMSATTNEVLFRRHLANPEGQTLVFYGPRSGRRMTSNTTYKRLEKKIRRLKLPDYGAYNHILRHTFASHAVMSGVPLLIVSAWLGHSSVKMTERYSHLIPSESHRRMEGFDLPPPEPPPALPKSPGT
jgi:integrase